MNGTLQIERTTYIIECEIQQMEVIMIGIKLIGAANSSQIKTYKTKPLTNNFVHLTQFYFEKDKWPSYIANVH